MQEEIYCYFCGKDLLKKNDANDFPPCEICGKVFSLKIFNTCSTCNMNTFNNFNEENIFNCKTCDTKICLCECRWFHHDDKKSCKCNNCVNNYNETVCESCNVKDIKNC